MSEVVTGLIGVLGVTVGIFIERIVQRYGKLRFVASEIGLWVRGEDLTGSKTEPRAVYGLPADIEWLRRAEWLEFQVKIQFFNEKEVRTGLREVAIIFSGPNSNPLVYTDLTKSGSPAGPPEGLDYINLPSREWISIDIRGGLHESAQGEPILDFAKYNKAEFRGYFPDGREFRHRLRAGGALPSFW